MYHPSPALENLTIRRVAHDETNFPQMGHHWRLLWLMVHVPQSLHSIEFGSCGLMFFHDETEKVSSVFWGMKLEMGSYGPAALSCRL